MLFFKINYDDSKPMFEQVEMPSKWCQWIDTCRGLLKTYRVRLVGTVLSNIYLAVDDCSCRYPDSHSHMNKVATMLCGSNADAIIGDAVLCRVNGDVKPLTDDDFHRVKRYFGWY